MGLAQNARRESQREIPFVNSAAILTITSPQINLHL